MARVTQPFDASYLWCHRYVDLLTPLVFGDPAMAGACSDLTLCRDELPHAPLEVEPNVYEAIAQRQVQ